MKIIKKENIKKKFEILTKFFLYKGVKQCCQYSLLSGNGRTTSEQSQPLLNKDVKQLCRRSKFKIFEMNF